MRLRLWLSAFALLAVLGPSLAGAYTLGDKFGLNINTGSPSVSYAAALAAQARFGWARIFVSWLATEPSQNTFDYSVLDPSVSAALANGLQVVLVIDTIPLWANGAPSNCTGSACAIPPTSTTFFRDFVTNLVNHYAGQVTYFEVWNEPDFNGTWNGAYSQYISDILINGARAVHAANPSAKVVGPTTYSTFSKFQQAANAACGRSDGGNIDVLSIHYYPPPPNDNATTFFNFVDAFQNYVTSPPCGGKPFWVTETGVNSWTNGDAYQSQQYVAMIQGVAARSYFSRLFFYQLEDGTPFPGPNGGKGWGLIGNPVTGQAPKPSFEAVENAILGVLNLPGVADTPLPRNGAASVPIATGLSWNPSPRAAQHNVYFGAGTPTFRGTQSGTSFQPPAAEMRYGQTFNWRIDEVDASANVTTGTSWSFTVQPRPATNPADILVQVSVASASSYYLQTLQGAGSGTFGPEFAMISTGAGAGANTDNLWNAQPNYHLKSGLDVFTAASTETPPNMTISVVGLNDGLAYNVYGRFVTAPAASGNGLTMGLNPGALTTYDQSSSGAVVTRDFGTWQEREVLLGQATVAGGAVGLTISNAGLSSSAAFSGMRLQLANAALIGNFYTLTPCRALDTRTTGVPLSSSTAVNVYQLSGACGIPASALSVALNFTGVVPSASLSIQAFPGDLAPTGTNVLSLGAGQVRAGFGVVTLATNGSGTLGIGPLFSGSGTCDLVIDVTGYFAP
jgi:hypothetical protein